MARSTLLVIPVIKMCITQEVISEANYIYRWYWLKMECALRKACDITRGNL